MVNFELKPCPFCGGSAKILRLRSGKYCVTCSSCGARGGAVWVKDWHDTPFPPFVAQGQAVKLWNARNEMMGG